jgi:hypothetical protein
VSLILLALLTPAHAARVYWTLPPSESERAALERTVPGASMTSLSERAAPPQTSDALTVLAAEVVACKPLFEVFDGELQVMARLQKAIADVRVLRTEQERALLQTALLTEGYAVQRYFQDRLAIEPDAAPYRTGFAGRAVVQAWAHAAALYAGTPPTNGDLPDASARLAFDATQAWVRVQPSGSVSFSRLAEGAIAYVDGRRVEAGPGARVLVSSGRHYVHVAVGDTIIWSYAGEVAPEQTVTVDAAFGPAERTALDSRLASGRPGWSVPAGLVSGDYTEPVYIAVTGGPSLRLLRVDGPVAVAVPVAADGSTPTGAGFGGYVAAGGGWVSTGDFYLQNADAPSTYATVNAGAPAFAAGAYWRKDWFEAGVGVDAMVATGAYHSLPTGASTSRAFVYPYAAVGLPWVQLTVGPQLPWYVGVGARAAVPIAGPLGLYGRFVYGVGVPLDRESAEAFQPQPALSASGGLLVDFGTVGAAR